MPELDRRAIKPVLVYWHCQTYWPIEEAGPICPMEHDTPIYDDRPRKGRKRLVWICGDIAYLSRREFLEHDVEDCYAEGV